ncbi:hypothetical protein ES703_98646 [subsurface metagenome]
MTEEIIRADIYKMIKEAVIDGLAIVRQFETDMILNRNTSFFVGTIYYRLILSAKVIQNAIDPGLLRNQPQFCPV